MQKYCTFLQEKCKCWIFLGIFAKMMRNSAKSIARLCKKSPEQSGAAVVVRYSVLLKRSAWPNSGVTNNEARIRLTRILRCRNQRPETAHDGGCAPSSARASHRKTERFLRRSRETARISPYACRPVYFLRVCVCV